LKTLISKLGFKVVIIGGGWHQYGVDSGPQNDAHESPVGLVYGAFVHANYVEALLDSRAYSPMKEGWAITLEVGFSAFLALCLVYTFASR